MSTKLNHIPTKSQKYGKYLYSTNTVRVTLILQICNSIHYTNIKLRVLQIMLNSTTHFYDIYLKLFKIYSLIKVEDILRFLGI